MESFIGRPVDTSGRLEKEIKCYDLLDSLGIDYTRVDHGPADTMEVCAAIEGSLGAPICKNLMLCNRQCTVFYLLMLPAGKNFRTSVLSKEIGSSRLSFAAPEYMEKFLDITPGSLSILGLMNDTQKQVTLLIDEEILQDEFIGCHPCINTSSLRLRTEAVMHTLIPALGHTPTIVKLPVQV